jgi:hypothetical protein
VVVGGKLMVEGLSCLVSCCFYFGLGVHGLKKVVARGLEQYWVEGR